MQALERLRRSLRTADVRKFYIALAVGKFQVQEGSFDLYFSGRYRRSKKVSVEVTGRAQQLGSCRWQVLGHESFRLPQTPLDSPHGHAVQQISESSPADSSRHSCQGQLPLTQPCNSVDTRLVHACLLRVQLIGGGRRHQIRAGLAHLGSPILGDSRYGGPPW